MLTSFYFTIFFFPRLFYCPLKIRVELDDYFGLEDNKDSYQASVWVSLSFQEFELILEKIKVQLMNSYFTWFQVSRGI